MAYPGRNIMTSRKAGISLRARICISIGMDDENPFRYISFVSSPSGSRNSWCRSRSGKVTSLVSMLGQYLGPMLTI
ncbi:MAG: hypothetical protein BWY95_01586 [Bacteroidetes bacterium ADurb.BinA104]|nr:MAG: hypothetical protein BWY95_01586 [Bacteroidetes bacterium ADurb.BinA104]